MHGSILNKGWAVGCTLALLALIGSSKSAFAISPPSIRPGHGYPGRLEACVTTPELQRQTDRFGLTAGWFRRDSLPPEAECHFKPAM